MSEEVIVKSKKLLYRGKLIEDLQKLDVRESVKFLPSRSRRSVLRNFQDVENFLKRCERTLENKKRIRTHLRDMVIVPKFVGMTIGIHNGKTYNDVKITHKMVGHRLGEFSLTRGKVNHGKAGLGSTKGSKGKKK